MRVEPRKPLHKSVGVLLIVAIIHSMFALMFLSSARTMSHQGLPIDKRDLIEALSMPFVFYVLALWAGRSPAVASIVGLVLYVVVQVVHGVTHPGQWGSALIIKIVIVVGLIRAVQTGLDSERARRTAAAAEGNGAA